MGPILTPDQRVRVFISSTIEELAGERSAVRAAIQSLQLIPVYFEQGARAHPPRELYRSYLEQSHVFIGIYGDSYGWIAPDMSISGLEDEYLLSKDIPRLLYIRKDKEARDPRLAELIGRISAERSMCYRHFNNVQELEQLVKDDLALLLSERFRSKEDPPQAGSRSRPPVPANKLLGREATRKAALASLRDPQVRTLTLTGAGGIGKTALALHLAEDLQPLFPDGIHFIPLAAVQDASDLLPAIFSRLEVYDPGHRSVFESIVAFLQPRRCLLLLDNFEQILNAAPVISDLIAQCPHIKLLVTSRSPLHIRGEQIMPLDPLPLPMLKGTRQELDELLANPAVALFVERVKSAAARTLTDPKALRAVASICHRLGGLPLAIELAAARCRLMSPADLEKRMESTLDTLTHGARDLPERQRTMRATIAWSHDLIEELDRVLFRRLALFHGGWDLASAEAVAGEPGMDVLSGLERLVDQGLVRVMDDGLPFNFFESVREFAREKLNAADEVQLIGQRHADHFSALVDQLDQARNRIERMEWVEQVDIHQLDVRAAFLFLMRQGDLSRAWHMIGELGYYWISAGRISEGHSWLEEAHISQDPLPGSDAAIWPTDLDRAMALSVLGQFDSFRTDFKASIEHLRAAVDLFLRIGEEKRAARTLGFLGLSLLCAGDASAMDALKMAVELGHRSKDDVSIILAHTFMSEILVSAGDFRKAKELLDDAVQRCDEQGDSQMRALSQVHRGNLLLNSGDHTSALVCYKDALEMPRYGELAAVRGWGFIGASCCYLEQGRLELCHEHILKAVRLAWDQGERSILVTALLELGIVAMLSGDPERAARCLGSAMGYMERTGFVFWKASQRLHETLVGHLNAWHDQPARVREEQIGRNYTDVQVYEHALAGSAQVSVDVLV